MKTIPLPKSQVFNTFKRQISNERKKGGAVFSHDPFSLRLRAVDELQQYLQEQKDWSHNFGLSGNNDTIIGKMFGILVVRTEQDEVGYLAAFSGKLAGGNHHTGFVPPIFDGTAEGGFLNSGMETLSSINEQIKVLEKGASETRRDQVQLLKTLRKSHSVSLQNEIFDQYHFLNQAGSTKSLREIFAGASYKSPPAGAGECAAPKLLQYAFQNKMKPLAMAEFWWGLSPKSATWKHRHFYPACKEKCAPILAHMLEGIEIAGKEA